MEIKCAGKPGPSRTGREVMSTRTRANCSIVPPSAQNSPPVVIPNEGHGWESGAGEAGGGGHTLALCNSEPAVAPAFAITKA
jgi:hypothetical protein